MRMPMLSVTGRTGACGNTKRMPGSAGSFSSGTIGTKSWPSAPRPCSQITLAEAGVAGARTTASAVSCMRWVMPAVLVLPVALLARRQQLDRLREAPLARRLLLRFDQPVDVLALLAGREPRERRARLRILLQRGGEVRRRLGRRLALQCPLRALARLVQHDGQLHRAHDHCIRRQLVRASGSGARPCRASRPSETRAPRRRRASRGSAARSRTRTRRAA